MVALLARLRRITSHERVERLNPTVRFRVKLQSKKKLLTKLVSPVSQTGQSVARKLVIIMLISAKMLILPL